MRDLIHSPGGVWMDPELLIFEISDIQELHIAFSPEQAKELREDLDAFLENSKTRKKKIYFPLHNDRFFVNYIRLGNTNIAVQELPSLSKKKGEKKESVKGEVAVKKEKAAIKS